jgi:hypothetical protein
MVSKRPANPIPMNIPVKATLRLALSEAAPDAGVFIRVSPRDNNKDLGTFQILIQCICQHVLSI